jgi:hypothetical protein
MPYICEFQWPETLTHTQRGKIFAKQPSFRVVTKLINFFQQPNAFLYYRLPHCVPAGEPPFRLLVCYRALSPQPMPALSTSALSSERRLAANRANAQLSTGPVTPEGKAKSSLNAVRTGLTGRAVLLATEDAAAYEAHIERFRRQWEPMGDRETELVQSLADTQWRLDRIPNLETGLFALGRLRCADLFEEEKNPQVRRAMIDAHILMTDAKHFKNLHLQESRLRRQYQQDAKELEGLQAQRKKEQEEQEQSRKTAAPKTLAASVGFEFTNSAVENRQKGKMETCPLSYSSAQTALVPDLPL